MVSKVYLVKNNNKGIIGVNFINPITGLKTTKSLGKKIGLDEEKARLIIKDIEEIINSTNYYLDYSGYLEARNKFDEIAIKCVYEKTELINKFNEEYRKKTIERLISIKDNEKNEFKANTIQFIGTPGSGKTKTIQQLIGSIEYNVPASTTSNTTFGSFEAYICNNKDENGMEKYEIAALLAAENEIRQSINENLIRVIIEFLIEENTLDYQSKYNSLFGTADMKLRLYMLVGERISEEYRNLLQEIKIKSSKLWNEYCEKNNIESNQYAEVSNEIKENFREHLEGQKDIDELEDYIIDKVEKDIKVVIEQIVNLLSEYDVTYSIEIVSNKNIYEFKNDDELNYIALKKAEWIKYISIKVSEKNNEAETIKCIFESLRLISCADEKIEKNLFPVVSNLRIKGPFKPTWNEKNNIEEEYILIDSEGVGHDVDNLNFSKIVEENMLYSNKIMWIINSLKDLGNQERFILETIALNGCLNKTTLCFNRLENMDSEAEGSELAKERRISLLLDNLFKSFEREYSKNNNIDFSVYKSSLKGRKLLFEHMDRKLNKNGIYSKEIEKLMENNEDIKKIIADKATKINVDRTIESFGRIIKLDKNNKKNINEKKLIYSWMKLSSYCDEGLNDYIKNFEEIIESQHWSTVRAFNSRMAFDWNNRSWKNIKPESDLLRRIKHKTMEILMNPKNIKKDEKESIINAVQEIQEIISKKIILEVKEIVYDNNKEKWEQSYYLNGTGSGNIRKKEINKINIDTFKFNRDENEENIIFTRLVKIINEIEETKNDYIKFKL